MKDTEQNKTVLNTAWYNKYLAGSRPAETSNTSSTWWQKYKAPKVQQQLPEQLPAPQKLEVITPPAPPETGAFKFAGERFVSNIPSVLGSLKAGAGVYLDQISNKIGLNLNTKLTTVETLIKQKENQLKSGSKPSFFRGLYKPTPLSAGETRKLRKELADLYDLKTKTENAVIKANKKSLAKKLKSSGAEDYKKAYELTQKVNKKYGNPKPTSFTGALGELSAASVSTVGSAITGVTVAALTKNPALGLSVGMGNTYLQEAGSFYTEAVQSGAEESQAQFGANIVGIANSILEVLPVGNLIQKLPSSGAIKSNFSRKVGDYVLDKLKSGAIEASTETMQQIVSNALKITYKENPNLFAGVPESFIFGGILGGLSDVVTDPLSITNKKEVISPQAIEKAEVIVSQALATEEKNRTEEQKEIVENVRDSINRLSQEIEFDEQVSEAVETIKAGLEEGEIEGAKEIYNELKETIPGVPTFGDIVAEFEKEREDMLIDAENAEIEMAKSILESPNVAQYRPIILKALKIFNLNKAKGNDDIATITKKVPELDEAIEALEQANVRVSTMEDIAEFYKKAAGKIKESGVEKPNKKAQKVPSGRGDVGGYATREEELKKIYGESFSKIKPIEMPELVQLAKELTGKTPTVTKKGLRYSLGKAYTESLDVLDIILRPDIFKTDFGGSFYDKEGMPEDIIVDESPKEQKIARLVLAHEIGHIMDALPEGISLRGNELGRIGTLKGFLKETFSDLETEAKIDELKKELKKNQEKRRALRDLVLDENGEPVIVNKRIKYEITDKEADKKLLAEVKRINKEIEKLQENAIKNSDIRRELKEWTQYWKPFDENAVSDSFRKYRHSSAELYADAISGLFNAPATLKEKAPIFWDAFFKFLNRKPKVEEAFNRLQDLINQEGDELYKRRDELINKAYKDAEAKFTAKELEKAQRKSRLWMDIKMLLDSKNAFVNAKVDQAIKEGKNILDENNPKYLLEELQYIDAYIKNQIEDLFQPVKDKAELVPDGWVQLGKILQLTRAITERGDMANPGGYDAKTATDQLNYLKRSMPEKDWNILKEAQEDFRKAQQEIVNIAEKNRFWNPKTIESMRANRDYATFQVIDYLDTYITPAVKRQQGTLKDIANPATSSVIKAINVLRAIERNNAKRETIDFFIKNFGDELEKAPTKWNGKFHEIVTKNKPGFEMVKIVRDGKLEGYYVDPYIAKSLNTANDVTIKALSELMRIVSGASFYRPLFTSINLGFQTYNVSRDFIRYWKNLPDKTLGEALKSFPKAVGFYKKAIKPSWDSVTGQRNELIREMEKMKILGLTYNDIHKNFDPEDAQIDRTLQKIGLAEPKNNKKGVAKVAVDLLNGIETLGNFIERLPKVAGYMQLKGQMSEKELAHFVRTKLGSPNFREGGTLTPVTNSMFLFSNSIKEGIKTDVIAATDPQTRSGYWWKTFMANILPKLLMIACAYGIFGERAKDIMRKASEYDKTNYTIIPLGEDKNGKAIYLRLPQDEFGRLVGAVIWKFLNSGNREELKFSDLAEVFSVFAGNVPSLAPNFTAFAAIGQYLSGNNPYDAFRGRNIIRDDAFAAGVKYSLPELVNWLIKNNGGGIIIPNYTPGDTDMTALEKTLNMPVLSNIIGRWVKVSNYGETEKLREISDNVKSKNAAERIEVNKSIKDAYEKYKKSDKSDGAYKKIATKLIEDVIGKPADKMNKEEIKKANAILKSLNRHIIKGRADPKVNALLFARSNDEKAELLSAMLEEMSKKEAKDFINQMLEEKIITEDVLRKYANKKASDKK